MSIVERFNSIMLDIPPHVRLVAVSKYQPISSIELLYQQQHRVFGESKVQELVNKYEALPKDIEWHFIGHLQTNKVKYIIPFVSLIHGVDSIKILKEINKCAQRNNKIVSCLLQVHIAQEETKFGFSFEDLDILFSKKVFEEFTHVKICGLMGMASNTNDKEQVRYEFRSLSDYYKKIKQLYFSEAGSFDELSMGMSGDYLLAIEEGSTLVRIGSSLFGEREYIHVH